MSNKLFSLQTAPPLTPGDWGNVNSFSKKREAFSHSNQFYNAYFFFASALYGFKPPIIYDILFVCYMSQ